MRIPDDCSPYLCGNSHSSSLVIPFLFDSSDSICRSRLDVLCDLAAEKRIINVGCVDHSIRKIKIKLKHDQWLHKRLCEVARRCVGVDILEDCIAYLRDELAIEDVFACDILKDELPWNDRQDWDCILLADVIEHIDNPVSFLASLRQRFADRVDEVIISTPNAMGLTFHRAARRGTELINSDHRYQFTPYTLAKVATVAGYRVKDIAMCRYGPGSRRRVVTNLCLKYRPLLRDGMVMRLAFD